MINITSGALFLLAGIAMANSIGADGELTKEEYKKLFDKIVPKQQERWQKIPWRIDLLDARSQAYKEKKPLFLWAMNGHPLGCT